MSSKIGVNKVCLPQSGFEARLICACRPPDPPAQIKFFGSKFFLAENFSAENVSLKKKSAEKKLAEKFIESIESIDDDLRIKIKKLFFIFTGTLSQVPLAVIVIIRDPTIITGPRVPNTFAVDSQVFCMAPAV